MGQREILLSLGRLLTTYQVPYLLTGSFAVSYYGSPRATHDIDFVIEVGKMSATKILKIIDKLGDQYIYDKAQVKQNILDAVQFNLVHKDSGIKVDFWVIVHDEFVNKFRRRQEVKIQNVVIPLISPEDLLLTKLFWCKQVFSERHFQDCVGIWKLQKDTLNKNYLTTQAQRLGITGLLENVISFHTTLT